MTYIESPYPAHLFNIRYVDPPRDAVPVRRRGRTIRRFALGFAAGAVLVAAAIGFAEAARSAPGAARDTDPGPGEFRLGLGLQQPPGYVVPLPKQPVPGEYHLGPGNQQPPGVVVPLGGEAGGSDAVPGEFRLGPGNQEPPGVVIPLG
jgi:hypothetical protein